MSFVFDKKIEEVLNDLFPCNIRNFKCVIFTNLFTFSLSLCTKKKIIIELERDE